MKRAVYSFFLGVLFTLGLIIAAVVYDRHPSVYGVIEREAKVAWSKLTGPDLDPNSFAICETPILQEVPDRSVLIIGHARSDLDETDNFPGPNIQELLSKNRHLISHVVFTGDVFATPSRKKWKSFKNFLSTLDMDYSIAPGNHEHLSGDNAARDIFLEQIGDMHGKTIFLPDSIVIIDDSTLDHWLFTDDFVDHVVRTSEKFPNRNVFVLRHNIPVKEMLGLANSQIDMAENLPGAAEIVTRFKNRSISIVSGDSGAFPNLPRYSCHKYQGISFLSNGLGGFEKDEALILHNGKIWRYQL